MADENKKEALVVNDGLTKIQRVESGESRKMECEIEFRPVLGLGALEHETDRAAADGKKTRKLIEDLFAEHLLAIRNLRSGVANSGAAPQQGTVKQILAVLDASTILEIERRLLASAWDVDKLLGN